ncbi:hypothetical protein VKT23_014261 [Stygiomarasmius scandens]|uniref:Uncharacterized protein n=1 Tax=Marasmiellus scandens TaxID=2682957 RepID=A0ABR1J3J0_9AGAR
MATARAIVSNAEHHTQLVEVLDSLESSPETLKEQTLYIEDLQRRVKRTEERVEDLEEKTREKKRAKTSVVRKMTSRVVRRKEELMARIEKEERAYVEALEVENRERETQEMLEGMIEEAMRTKRDLEVKVERRIVVQNDLTALYSRVFGNFRVKPRGEFLQNDGMEQHLKALEDNYNSLKDEIIANEKVVELLEEADQSITVSSKYLEEGLRHYATWGKGVAQVLTEMDRELRCAARAASQAESSFNRARTALPLIQPLQPLTVYPPDTLRSGTITEENEKAINIAAFTAIKDNKNNMVTAQKTVRFEIRSMGSRIRLLKVDLSKVEKMIEEAKEELSRVRREIWNSVVEGKARGNERWSLDANGSEDESTMRIGVKKRGMFGRLTEISPPPYDVVAIEQGM